MQQLTNSVYQRMFIQRKRVQGEIHTVWPWNWDHNFDGDIILSLEMPVY